MKSLPPRTKDLWAKKGELYLLLKALVRAARRTFRRDPARAASFGLSLLGRGGTTRQAPGTTPAP